VSAPTITSRRIGAERQPIAIVEDFHPSPDALRMFAVEQAFAPASHHYPGLRAPLPADYFQAVREPLAAVLRQVFGALGSPRLIDASFSVVTTPAADLSVAQRIPHFDALEPGRVALVHYLMPEGGDGTAFFRHRATGFERIDPARAPAYFAALDAELAADEPEGYVRDTSPLFERTELVGARFNRAALYRSAQLHSGAISPGARLDADPLTGRLTVTAFLTIG